MIQAVSKASAFQIGQRYMTDDRVRIVEAGDAQIASTVIGNSGLYEQAIRLKDGHLLSTCSCPLSEEPMCRHCIAALLEYHRRAQPRPSETPSHSTESPPSSQAAGFVSRTTAAMHGSVADVKLSEVLLFIEWLQPATRAIQNHEHLPDPPTRATGEIATWIHTIRGIAEGRGENDQATTKLMAEIRDREAHGQRLAQELQIAMDEVKAAQRTVDELQLELVTHKETLADVSELATAIVGYEEELRVAAGDLIQNGSQVDKLACAVKELAQALKVAVKPTLQ